MSGLAATSCPRALRSSAALAPKLAPRPKPCTARRARSTLRAVAYQPPSSAPADTELAALERLTTVVPDTLLGDDRGSAEAPNSAVVSSAILAGILSNPTGLRQFENAIEKAVSFDQCFVDGKKGAERNACQYDKALTNIGCMYADMVTGVVSTEIDPRTYDDVDAMVARGKQILEMYRDDGIPADRVTVRLPATFKALKACKALTAAGIRVHLTGVYSVQQAAAAIDAGAALLQVHVGKVNDWYDHHPGVIRDPHGPREDTGAKTSVDVGVRLAKRIYDLSRVQGGAEVMVVGIRSKAAALALAGVDYMVLGAKVLNKLSETATLAGYNDGLAGGDLTDDVWLEPALTPAAAALTEFKPEELALHAHSAQFELALGYAAQDLLKLDVLSATMDIERAMSLFEHLAVSPGE